MKSPTIKVLVVEDEILLLKNIVKKINSISDDFQVIGQVFNGEEALDLIQNCRPDIVFTDIRMPIMGGLELIKILYQQYPDIVTVIISGYDDFEYARSVLQYKVFDYLLKPIQIDTLKKLLISLRENYMEAKNNQCFSILSNHLNRNVISLDDTFLFRELENSSYSMFLFCFGNLHLRCKILSKKNDGKILLNEATFTAAMEAVSFTYSDCYIFPYESNTSILLVEDLSGSIEETGISLYNALKKESPEAIINLAYHTENILYNCLPQALETLYTSLSSSLVIGVSRIFTAQIPGMEPPAVLSLKEINYIQTILNSDNIKGFQNILRDYFNNWHSNGYPQRWIEKILLHILAILQQNLLFSEEDYKQIYNDVFYTLETEPEITRASEKIIFELAEWLNARKATPTEIGVAIEALDNYIHSHYTEPISLAEISEKYHFNYTYLSRIFKKQKGESPLKLINTLRINDAKELLLNKELSIREISEMLGFSNQHYFSRIFKEFTNETPKIYRVNHKLDV